tara:strand:+ start:47 stop:685 length:639 start_codon:yes stop_codon:yes gene_type:complete
MDNITISIFGNKIFFEILSEIKLFTKYNIKFYKEFNLCAENAKKLNQIVIFFIDDTNKKLLSNNNLNSLSLILISKKSVSKNTFSNGLVETLKTPFTILDLDKKIVSIFAKYQFKKNSLIFLNNYIIDKNERKLKKNNLEIKLSEKEINFLVLFSKSKIPISKNEVLKKVWNYSSKSETHTVETHVHRLRKKILDKFGDNHFIKNNNSGYYI